MIISNINHEDIKILYAEDNQYNTKLIIKVFKKINIRDKVHGVKDGVKVLDFVFGTGEYLVHNLNFLPKVIFLDLKLPKLSSIEVLKKIKSNEYSKAISINFEKISQIISNIGLYWINYNKILI